MNYTDNDDFDTYMLVSEAKALLNLELPEALGGFGERIRMKLEELGIDF